MKQPTAKAYMIWTQQFPWRENPAVVCSYCGALGNLGHTQPVHPYFVEYSPSQRLTDRVFVGADGQVYRCTACGTKHHERAVELRKQELAELPRCVAGGCTARGSWNLRGELLCGRHKKAVLRTVHSKISQSGLGGLAMFGDIGQGALVGEEIARLKHAV